VDGPIDGSPGADLMTVRGEHDRHDPRRSGRAAPERPRRRRRASDSSVLKSRSPARPASSPCIRPISRKPTRYASPDLLGRQGEICAQRPKVKESIRRPPGHTNSSLKPPPALGSGHSPP
jgi:hypothetical protein